MTYFVRRFVTQQGPNGQLIVFRAGQVYSVTVPAMQATVLDLEKHCGEIVSQQRLGAIFSHRGVDGEPGQCFLVQELRLLVPAPRAEDTAISVLVVTDRPSLGQTLVESLRLPKPCSIRLSSLADMPVEELRDPLLAVMVLTDYSPTAVRSLYRQLSTRPNAAFLTAYLDGPTLAVDGLYLPNCGLPCHFCHRERVASADRNRLDIQAGSWIAIQEQLEQIGITAPPPIAMDAAIQGVIAFTLRVQIEGLLGIGGPPLLADRVGLAQRIDLNTGQRTADKVFHWELCDCLHGDWP